MSQRVLIVTADDFGLHASVNEAVERASRFGVLTAASLMVAGPAAADAVERAHRLPQLRVGLHLVMADGMAALAPDLIPALVDARGWMSNKMFTNGLRFFALPAVRRQLEAEIRAQFASFARTGLALDHVNAHKHFHLHPSLLAMMVRIGVEYGVSAVRVPAEPIWFAARGGSRLAAASSAVLLRPWIEWMRRRLRAAGLRSSDRVFGIGCSGNMDEQALLEVLGRLPPGVSEIYLHPATESGSAIASSMAAYRHADELAALLSPRVRAAVVATGARLGGYREIL